MDALTTLPVRRVPFSADIEKPGDHFFISKREPIRKFEREPIAPPTGLWRMHVWLLAGRPTSALKEIVEIVALQHFCIGRLDVLHVPAQSPGWLGSVLSIMHRVSHPL